MNLENIKIAENKILILYIINQFKMPLTESQLIQFILEKEFMNYFVFKQHLSELTASQMIEYNASEKYSYYLISKKGEQTLEIFGKLIADDVKSILDNEIILKKNQFKKDSEIITNYVMIGEFEYIVYLMAIEKGTPLIDLRLNVGSKEQAEELCKNWKRNSSEYFKKIISIITKSEN